MKLPKKLLLPLLGLAALSAPRLAEAANCTVTLGTDTGIAGELRDCIDNVATTAGDVVTIDPNLTVTLTAGEIDILQSITIQGAGAGSSVVDGGDNSRIFDIGNSSDSISVNIAGVTIQNGNAGSGAGIYINQYVALRLFQTTVTSNYANSSYGGGIYNYYGSLILEDSDVTLNESANDGGGIYNNEGILTLVAGSTVNKNFTTPGNSSNGGGIYNYYGVLELRDGSVVSANTADDSGGGIANEYSSMTIENSAIGGANASDGNTATNGDGGGIYNYYSNLVTEEANISNNQAIASGYYGGGIYNEYSGTTLTNSVLSGNSAEYGGAIYNYSDSSQLTIIGCTISGNHAVDADDSGDGYGGGIYNDDYSSVVIANSTLSGNAAVNDGGGIYTYYGTLTFSNSTLSGNTADNNGGGIFNEYAYAFNLNNVTIANNVADADNSGGGDGGGIYNESDGYTLSFSNTIIANNSVNGPGANPDCFSDFTNDGNVLISRGHNLIGVVSANCEVLGDLTGNLSGDPGLDPNGLQDNGGPTETIALVSGSQAINAGDNALCKPIDQRGVPRPQEDNCDIGAFEFAAAPPVPTPTPIPPPGPTPNVTGSGCSLSSGLPMKGSMAGLALMSLSLLGLVALRRKA